MVDQVWKLSEHEPAIMDGGDFYSIGIDYMPKRPSDFHWSKVEIHGEVVEDIQRLAEIIVAALNERENISDG